MIVNLKPGKGPGQKDLRTKMMLKTTAPTIIWRNDSAIFREKVSNEGRASKIYKPAGLKFITQEDLTSTMLHYVTLCYIMLHNLCTIIKGITCSILYLFQRRTSVPTDFQTEFLPLKK